VDHPGTTDIAILGLEPHSNRLRPYTSRWPLLYEAEAQAIRRVLGALALDVQHVGSTSVPGLSAKPILDIAVAVARLQQYRDCIAPLVTLGYEHVSWAGIERDEVFGKGKSRTHLVHVVEFGSDIWLNYITFRDRLRSNAVLAQEYERLKFSLIQSYPDNRAAYTSAKHDFIRRVLDAA